MAKIILVRHGKTAASHARRFRGRADVALGEFGIEQAKAASECIAALHDWRPTVVYTSPMQRCVTTATIIGDTFSAPVHAVDALTDIHYGDWEELTVGQIKQRWPREFEVWCQNPQCAEIPGGETLQQVSTRVRSAFKALVDRHRRDTFAVVSHNSVNRLLLLQVLDLPLSHYRSLTLEMGGISRIEYSNGRCWVKSVNETYHLTASQRINRGEGAVPLEKRTFFDTTARHRSK